MKRSYFILAGVLAVLLLGAGIKAHAADPDILYVRYIEGSVGLAEAGSAQTMDAVVNTPLIEGDTVVTGRSGKAELFLKDGSLVRIGEDSVMRVTAVADDGVQFKLEHGSAYIISQGSREVPLFLDTPLTALDIASPSTVRVDAYGNGVDEISVLKGSIFASRQASGRMLVGQGQRLVVKADGSIPGVARLRTPGTS
jgi:ferric-dicitrate binding protein FerR (iron transport regulator)